MASVRPSSRARLVLSLALAVFSAVPVLAQIRLPLVPTRSAPDPGTPMAAGGILPGCAQCDLLYAGDCGAGLWSIDPVAGTSTLLGSMPENMFDLGMASDGRLFGISGGGAIYELSTCDGTGTNIASTFGFSNGMGGDLASTDLFLQGPPLERFDTVGLGITTVGGAAGGGPPFWCGTSSGDIAHDPVSGLLYSSLVACAGCAGDALMIIDPLTGGGLAQVGCIVDAAGAPLFAVYGLAFDSAGRLWASLGNPDPAIWLVDTTTAVATRVPISGGYDCSFGLASLPCPAVVDEGCEPLTQGFWKRVCEKTHPSGEHEALPGYVSCVSASATFRDVSTVEDLCDRMHPDPSNDKCEQAEAQFMALLLNTCSGRLGRSCCIEIEGEDVETVGDAIDLVDGLLSSRLRNFRDCVRAQAIADAINTGAALCDRNTLTLTSTRSLVGGTRTIAPALLPARGDLRPLSVAGESAEPAAPLPERVLNPAPRR
jgi:hypothetical protein